MKGVLSIQSHVTYGHAGNSAAVFPMQRMGLEVWPIHTVHFSNHTQYNQGWTGKVVSADAIAEVFEGLEKIGVVENIQAIVTGYLGDASHCDVIANIIKKVKAANPDCLYLCDPVMGDPEKGCIVSDGVAESLVGTLMPMADVLVPNQFELTRFTGQDIHSVEDAIAACSKAQSLGPDLVLAKHLHGVKGNLFSMLLASSEGTYLAQRPHLTFPREPVGVGDMISATFLAGLINGLAAPQALEHCNNAVYGILEETAASNQWELQLIAGQKQFETPSNNFKIDQL
ncbi:pyridoxal kinase PdxY [uncultured Cohaesibacter sp.]|uniref:pyridoxal kinase PdxY n=1 Tax=uncultured Cohaesibacter sp. TaxID=1002546 RepID=UPI002AA65977|nr:pyridoxal kinase PdxY [uncultured Cohaesibacter sp.]